MTRILITSFLLFLSGGGGSQKVDVPVKPLEVKRPIALSIADTSKVVAEYLKEKEVTEKNLADFRDTRTAQLRAADDKIASLEKENALLKKANSYLANKPAKTDTLFKMATPLVVKTVYKGLIPIPGTNQKKAKKMEQQVKDLFMEVERVQLDTIDYEYTYIPKF